MSTGIQGASKPPGFLFYINEMRTVWYEYDTI